MRIIPVPSSDSEPVELRPVPVTQGDEQLRQNTQEIARLSDDVAALRKTLADIQETREPPAPEPPPMMKDVLPAQRQDLLKAIADMQSTLETPPVVPAPPKKVAFIRKLWDYLNQTAFEIPPNKSNRTH